MILTKEYRLVWDSEILVYGQFSLDTQTETSKNTYECDTQTELDNKVTSLGFEIPEPEPVVPESMELPTVPPE